MANDREGNGFEARMVTQREMTQAIAARVDPLAREVDTQRVRMRDLGEERQRDRVKLALLEERMVAVRTDLDRLDGDLRDEREKREAAVIDARKYAATLVGDYEARMIATREREREQLHQYQNQAIARASVWVAIAAMLTSTVVALVIAAWKG